MSENNFRVCEEVQHNRVFVTEEGGGAGWGAENASIYALSGYERIEKYPISQHSIARAHCY